MGGLEEVSSLELRSFVTLPLGVLGADVDGGRHCGGRNSRASAFWVIGFLRLPEPHSAQGPPSIWASSSVSRVHLFKLASDLPLDAQLPTTEQPRRGRCR
jgi:hypothetical protein